MSPPNATSSPFAPAAASAAVRGPGTGAGDPQWVDLRRRRDELAGRLAEMQWDLGGLAYEMAIRNHVKVDVLVRQAAALQAVDGELCEVERILRTEQTGTAGLCANCQAPHSGGAAYCWQCGQALLAQVPSYAIGL